jgi:hypothetical protein
MKTRRFLLTLLAGAATLAAGHATAQQQRPIRLVVPYAAGGPIDVTARMLAERVKDALGPVIVDNKPGAGGNIGADIVAKAPPDGLTIGIAATATNAVNPWLYSKIPFNAATDFAPITQMVRVPNVLVMNAETAQRLHIEIRWPTSSAMPRPTPPSSTTAAAATAAPATWRANCSRRKRASSRCTFRTTAATRRSWR